MRKKTDELTGELTDELTDVLWLTPQVLVWAWASLRSLPCCFAGTSS